MPRAGRRKPKEVFLSHSVKDRRFARRLANFLSRQGIPVWYSEHKIVGAEQWHDEIGAALQRCDWFAVLLSPHSVRSRWVKRELVYALSDARYAERIVPVLYKQCDYRALSWTLGGFQMVSFLAGFDEGSRHLLKVWRPKFK